MTEPAPITAGQRMAAATRKGAKLKGEREKDDFYPTPPEATRALLSVESFQGSIWEPACGDGAISKVLIEHGHTVFSSDLVDRGFGVHRVDFLMEHGKRVANIVTNPPFKLAEAFAAKACELAERKVALLLPLRAMTGQARARLWRETGLSRVWLFERRLTMWRNGEAKTENSGMTDYGWFVWECGAAPSSLPRFGWLP